MKHKKIYIMILLMIISLQVGLRLFVGAKKEYFHMDEAYSYGLMNYDKIQLTHNKDFYEQWHTKDYYLDYLAIHENEVTNLNPVYENQKNDVHPPFYYLLLRIASMTTIDSFSKWTGIVLNIFIFVFSSVLLYLIAKKLFRNPVYALLTVFVSGFTLVGLEMTVFIRMYELAAFCILLTTYLSLFLFQKKDIKIRYFVLLGASFLLGGLTHYYYFIYVAGLSLVLLYYFIKAKQKQNVKRFLIMVVVSAIIYLGIFPYAIYHIFFSYRGAGNSIETSSFMKIVTSISYYLSTTNKKMFAGLFSLILVSVFFLTIHRVKLRVTPVSQKLYLFIAPSLLYFFTVPCLVPFQDMRYIMPITPMLALITVYLMKMYLHYFYQNRKVLYIMVIIFTITLSAPKLTKQTLELTYENNNQIASRVASKNVPLLYILDPSDDRFLSDIYLFTLADDSFILNQNNLSEAYLLQILAQKDMSDGFILLLADIVDKEETLAFVMQTTGIQSSTLMQEMYTASVYYLH